MAIGDQSVSNKGGPRTPVADPVRCGRTTFFLSAGSPLRPTNTFAAEDYDDNTDVAADGDCDIRVLYNKVNVLPLIDVHNSDDESGTDDCFFRVVQVRPLLPCTVTAVTESTGSL